jgi:hypothetical protein
MTVCEAVAISWRTIANRGRNEREKGDEEDEEDADGQAHRRRDELRD